MVLLPRTRRPKSIPQLSASRPQVTLYTDGSFDPNSQNGGWAAVLLMDVAPARFIQRDMAGFVQSTTNFSVEMIACVNGLLALKTPCDVTLYSDEQIIVESFKQGRVERWQRNGWRGPTNRKPIRNQYLWQQLASLCQIHHVMWIWVEGHSGDYYNERADVLSRHAMRTKKPFDQRELKQRD